MDEIIIKCAECGIFLTPNLKELPKDFVCSLEDETDYLPQGFYKKNDGLYWKVEIGKIIINKKDLVNSINHNTDSKRLSGCCGLDGFMVNKMCANGHEVATEFSDCWMPHCAIFEPNKIKIYKINY